MNMITIPWLSGLLQYVFPQYCAGCGSDHVTADEILCIECHAKLPLTNFFGKKDNLVEKKFLGRLSIAQAGSAYYFTKDSTLEKLIYGLKYQGRRQNGIYLGRQLGLLLSAADWATSIDYIIPLPLSPKREFERGYNQSLLLAEGLSQVTQIRILSSAVIRKQYTETQTHKGRTDRMLSMQDKFQVVEAGLLKGKHILLLDDVITTGASLESCGAEILRIGGTRLSIATIGCTFH